MNTAAAQVSNTGYTDGYVHESGMFITALSTHSTWSMCDCVSIEWKCGENCEGNYKDPWERISNTLQNGRLLGGEEGASGRGQEKEENRAKGFKIRYALSMYQFPKTSVTTMHCRKVLKLG